MEIKDAGLIRDQTVGDSTSRPSHYRDPCRDCHAEIGRLRKISDNWRQSTQDGLEVIRNLQTINDEQHTQNMNNTTEINELNRVINPLTCQIKGIAEENDSLHDTINEQHAQINSLTTRVWDAECKVIKISDIVDRTDPHYRSTETESIAAIVADIPVGSAIQTDGVAAELDSLRVTVEKQNKNLDTYENIVCGMREGDVEARAIIKKLNHALEDGYEQNSEFRADLQKKNCVLDSIRNRLQLLVEDKMNMYTVIDEINTLVHTSPPDNSDGLEEEYKCLREMHNRLNDTIDRKNATIKTQNETIHIMDKTIDDAHAIVKEIQYDIRQYESTITINKEKIQEQTGIIEEQRVKNTKQYSRIINLEHRLAESNDEECERLRNVIGKLDAENVTLRKQIANCRVTIKEYDDVIRNLNALLTSKNDVIKEMRDKPDVTDNFWSVIGERDATIKQQKITIASLERDLIEESKCNDEEWWAQ